MVNSAVLAEGRYLRFLIKDGYEFVERINCTGIVAIIAVTSDQKIILVEQFRKPLKKNVIELPAGLVSDSESARGETLESAAYRELLEETGYQASHFEKIDVWPTSSGMTSESVTIFRAKDLVRVSAGGGDAEENITVHVIALDKISQWLDEMKRKGKMIDPKIYGALYLI